MMHSFKAAAKGEESAPKRMAHARKGCATGKAEGTIEGGLKSRAPLEPAHGLYDLCAAMIERNEILLHQPQ